MGKIKIVNEDFLDEREFKSPYSLAICTKRHIRCFKNRQYSFDVYHRKNTVFAGFLQPHLQTVIEHYFGVKLLDIYTESINIDQLMITKKRLKRFLEESRQDPMF